MLAEGGAEVFLLGERGKYPPFGVNGGKPAALNRFVYETDAARRRRRSSEVTDVEIGARAEGAAGDAGGRGLRRSGDARAGACRARRSARYVSPEAARRDYKVVLREDGSLDTDATAKARVRHA